MRPYFNIDGRVAVNNLKGGVSPNVKSNRH